MRASVVEVVNRYDELRYIDALPLYQRQTLAMESLQVGWAMCCTMVHIGVGAPPLLLFAGRGGQSGEVATGFSVGGAVEGAGRDREMDLVSRLQYTKSMCVKAADAGRRVVSYDMVCTSTVALFLSLHSSCLHFHAYNLLSTCVPVH